MWRAPAHTRDAPVVPGIQEEELVELLARHCYVQLGATVKSEAVRELLPSCVPSKLYRTKSPEKWASLVTTAHAKVSLGQAGRSDPEPFFEGNEMDGSLPP